MTEFLAYTFVFEAAGAKEVPNISPAQQQQIKDVLGQQGGMRMASIELLSHLPDTTDPDDPWDPWDGLDLNEGH